MKRDDARHTHAQASRIGLLLINLGTPDEPTPAALRRYLGQFLSDPRVIEIPMALWKPLLHGIILRVRPAKSAAKYASIWMPEGSPLRVWTERQTKLLTGYLGERGRPLLVRHAMRYGNPSIESQMQALVDDGATRVLVLPLYPQYSAATTATALDRVFAWARQARRVPELRTINHFHDDADYIDALASSISAYWMKHGRPDKLLMSFHGMPRRTLTLGDPYFCECQKTARLLAARLSLKPEQWVITFQSRFGRAEWLQPYTEPTLRELGKAGCGRVDVVCPGFVADCIETLEEIAMEGREAFLESGGKDFHYIPCLNDDPRGMAALTRLVERHLQGWEPAPEDAAALQVRQERARRLGAAQ
ncbi:MAG: ferrochelatase [Pseudomonadota bacterium]